MYASRKDPTRDSFVQHRYQRIRLVRETHPVGSSLAASYRTTPMLFPGKIVCSNVCVCVEAISRVRLVITRASLLVFPTAFGMRTLHSGVEIPSRPRKSHRIQQSYPPPKVIQRTNPLYTVLVVLEKPRPGKALVHRGAIRPGSIRVLAVSWHDCTRLCHPTLQYELRYERICCSVICRIYQIATSPSHRPYLQSGPGTEICYEKSPPTLRRPLNEGSASASASASLCPDLESVKEFQ